MKYITYKMVALLAFVSIAAPVLAELDPQVVNVPISRPGEPVNLDISILSARIEVIGENRDDAVFEVSVSDSQRRIVTPSGTQVVKGGAYSLEIEEEDNEISFDADWRSNKVTVLVRIPRRANLDLSTVNKGEIIVSNVEGNLKLSNVNGPITATNISGSVIAEAVNKPIKIHFDRIDDTNATSLESINGDLHLGLPGNAGVQLQLDTARGKIYSDFEVEVSMEDAKVERKDHENGAVIRIDSAIVAKINGGGPIVRMKGLYGDIYIEKSD